jgi:hypothetical protein
MTIQQLIISEVAHQPEPVLRQGYGSVPGIILAEDFDAPLADFADYLP